MGRATRWLKGLFGIAKSNKADPRDSNSGPNNSKRHVIDVLSFENDPKAVMKDEFYASRTARLRASSSSCHLETYEERNKHAVAVVVATAAAADAALVAARAAAEVLRFTGPDSRVMDSVRELGKCDYKSFAAIKIQSFFRGYLARKALRALKGLVKLQAMVRGYLVRTQAKATLRSMEALMRAQAMARFRRSHRPLPNSTTIRHSSRSRMYSMAQEALNEIEDSYGAPIHSRRLSASLDVRTTETVHHNLKIVEVDHVKPLSRPYPNTSMSDIRYAGLSPMFPSHNAYKPPVLEDSPRYFEEYRCLSSKSTPRFLEPIGSDNFVLKPVEGRLVPSYMTSTRSFSAKSRSHSAPKQRPHRLAGDKNNRRLSVHETMDVSRSSLSGIRMQRSCSKAQEVIYMKKQAVGG